MHIGLNFRNAHPEDDVIVDASTGDYHAPNPAVAGPSSMPRIPFIDTSDWNAPNPSYG